MTNATTHASPSPASLAPAHLYPAERYDLTDLRLFLAVADTGSVTRGAPRCHLAVSSASLRIAGLEAALGVQLFQRQARGVALTQAGRVMVEHARRCLAMLSQMHADLAPYASGLKGQVVLLANSSAIASYLPADLEAFFAARPGVRIALEERLSADIMAAVASGRADVGILAWSGDHPDLDFKPYREDELVLLVSADNPLARRKAVHFADCLDQAFVSLHSGAAIHTFVVERAAALGHRLDIRVQVSGFPAVARLVASGAGVGVVPRSAVDARMARLRVLRLQESWAPRKLCICTRKGAQRLNAHAKALVAHLARPR
jgi:DNA-binding transcriptional LysR family regulator